MPLPTSSWESPLSLPLLAYAALCTAVDKVCRQGSCPTGSIVCTQPPPPAPKSIRKANQLPEKEAPRNL